MPEPIIISPADKRIVRSWVGRPHFIPLGFHSLTEGVWDMPLYPLLEWDQAYKQYESNDFGQTWIFKMDHPPLPKPEEDAVRTISGHVALHPGTTIPLILRKT